ncbi:hypothetical protein ABPG75_008554 [Micractinium tetrahymenae]
MRRSETELRAGVERVCRRWRQLALSLPSTLALDTEQLGPTAAVAEATLERLLPLLRARTFADLRLTAGQPQLSPCWHVLLARSLFPDLCRLELAGAWPRFTAFLPLCTRLEELSLLLCESGEHELGLRDAELLASQLCGLPTPPRHLRIAVSEGPLFFFFGEGDEAEQDVRLPLDTLLRQVGRHMRDTSLSLSLARWHPPDASADAPYCTPQLRSLSVNLGPDQDRRRFTAGLRAGLLGGLEELELLDFPDHNEPATLAGLHTLPRLRRLQARGFLPKEGWLCPHLTVLRCIGVLEDGTDRNLSTPPAAVLCTGLRRLQYERCELDHALSPLLCAGLGLLTGLAFVGCQLNDPEPLPRCFTQLSSLRRLAFDHSRLGPEAFEVLKLAHAAESLTALSLRDCGLEVLPLGLGASYLLSLDVSENDFLHALPFAITAGDELKALALDFHPDMATQEGWEDLRSKLTFLRCLKVIHLCSTRRVHPTLMDTAAEAAALAARLRAECGCRVVLDDPLSQHPGGLGWEPADGWEPVGL